jgi:hypothetical protein
MSASAWRQTGVSGSKCDPERALAGRFRRSNFASRSAKRSNVEFMRTDLGIADLP